MKLKLSQIGDGVLFEAANSRGHRVRVEGRRDLGGTDAAPSPTELLVISEMGCTAIDVRHMLGKMRQPVARLDMEAEAWRKEGRIPAVLERIHLHYILFGDIRPEKAEQAIRRSIDRYCVVSKMIDGVVQVTTSFEIHPADAAPAPGNTDDSMAG